MPWAPELFTAPALQQLLDRRRRDKLLSVPFFDGLLMGEPDALVESFGGEPELHDPVRGRVKGVRAFRAFADELSAWLAGHAVSIEDVERIILQERGFEEVILHFDGVHLPWAVVTDHAADGRIGEMRIYHGIRPLTGHRADRPPLLQPDPELRLSDVVAEYQRALAAGDSAAVVAAFEPDGSVREPAGEQRDVRAFHDTLFSHGGGIPLEHCVAVDDGRACALEYNVAQWGTTPVVPAQAGFAVHVRGASGKLAAVRVYDDAVLR